MAGPFGAVGFEYRFPLSSGFDVGAGLDFGAVFARTRDPWTAQATSGGNAVEVAPQPSTPTANSAAVFAMPALAARVRFGAFSAGVGVAAIILLFDGPRYDTLSVQPLSVCPSPAPVPPPLECARGDSFVENERAYRRTLIWVPNVSAGWRF